jgi:hypothetical protein
MDRIFVEGKWVLKMIKSSNELLRFIVTNMILNRCFQID